MDDASLISRESVASTTSSKRRRFRGSIAVLTKFSLHSRDSKASLHSHATASSGWSRVLVPWYPKTRCSLDESHNGSTNAIVAYPDRDPARLLLVSQTSTEATVSAKGVPCLPPGFQGTGIGGQYPPRNLTPVQAQFPLTSEEIALLAIATNVQMHAGNLDQSLTAALELTSILDEVMVLSYFNEQNQQLGQVRTRILSGLEMLSAVLGTPKSIITTSYLLEHMALTEYKNPLRSILQHLCDSKLLTTHRNDILYSCALVFGDNPERSVELAGKFQQCLVDNLARYLSPMSPTSLLVKCNYCLFLILTGDMAAARAFWEQIDFDDFDSIQDKVVCTSLLDRFGEVSLKFKEYAVAKRYFTMKVDIDNCVSTSELMRARMLRRMAECDFQLNLNDAALRQAEATLSL